MNLDIYAAATIVTILQDFRRATGIAVLWAPNLELSILPGLLLGQNELPCWRPAKCMAASAPKARTEWKKRGVPFRASLACQSIPGMASLGLDMRSRHTVLSGVDLWG